MYVCMYVWTNGVSTDGVIVFVLCFLTEELLVTPISINWYSQRCQGVPFCPNLPKSITFAAAPLALTPFVRSQETTGTAPGRPHAHVIVAICYPFSQFCEIKVSLLSLQTQPNTAPILFQKGVEYGKYVCGARVAVVRFRRWDMPIPRSCGSKVRYACFWNVGAGISYAAHGWSTDRTNEGATKKGQIERGVVFGFQSLVAHPCPVCSGSKFGARL